MWHHNFRGLVARLIGSHKGTQRNNIVFVLCLAIIVSVLASCGSVPTGQAKPVTSTPRLSPSPTAIPTRAPTATPTPTLTPQPTQPAAAILDVRPSSMSIVGHLDCQKNGAFVCFARVLSRSSNQSDLHWTAFTNVPGHIVLSPSSGVLAPGQSVLLTITVPFNACTSGLFFFQG